MVLHKMMFLQLPYLDTEDFAVLHSEILAYPGFSATPDIIQTCERRHIPRNLLLLLERLLHVSPDQRPTAERVKKALPGLRSRRFGSGLWSRGRDAEDGMHTNVYQQVGTVKR